MNNPADGSRGLLFKRVIWLLVAAALVTAVIAIYLFLRPSPRRLADPEEFSLAAGERFTLEDLPMGSRYRLRACERSSELRARIGAWSLAWTRLEPNPLDDTALDLRLDGRPGGSLEIEARSDTGRLILFRETMQVTCRGDDPRDLTWVDQRLERQQPTFECDEERLVGLEPRAAAKLHAELLARRGQPLSPEQQKHLEGLSWFRKRPAATPLSEEEAACQARLEALMRQPSAAPVQPAVEGTPAAPAVSDPNAPAEAGTGSGTAQPSGTSAAPAAGGLEASPAPALSPAP